MFSIMVLSVSVSTEVLIFALVVDHTGFCRIIALPSVSKYSLSIILSYYSECIICIFCRSVEMDGFDHEML